jgi:replicative DNA helicase
MVLEEMVLQQAFQGNPDVLSELDDKIFENAQNASLSRFIAITYVQLGKVSYDAVRASLNADKRVSDRAELLEKVTDIENGVFGYYEGAIQDLKDEYRVRELKKIFTLGSRIGDGNVTLEDMNRLINEAEVAYHYGLTEDSIHTAERLKEKILNRTAEEFEQSRLYFSKGNQRSSMLRIYFDGDYMANRLYVVSGLPSMGKNILVDNMAVDFCFNKKAGTYFSFDNNRTETTMKLLSIATKIPYKDIESGRLGMEERQKLSQIDLSYINIIDSKMTINQMRRILEIEKKQRNIKYFVIDYFTNIRTRGRQGKVEQYEQIALDLKVICKELDLVCVCLAQLNREGMIKWCQGVFEEAYFSLKIESENPMGTERDVVITKNKTGPRNSYKMRINGAWGEMIPL